MTREVASALALALLAWGCTGKQQASATSGSASAATPVASGAGPLASAAHTPASSAASAPATASSTQALAGLVIPDVVAAGSGRVPFILLLHGYGGTGQSIAQHFGFGTLASTNRFVFLAPDGVADRNRARFWNAGPACCDFDGRRPDHVRELGAIVAAAREHPKIDPDRVFVVGYSNGGFMAHRLACDVPGIAGIASVAGAAVADPGSCKHVPRRILQVHGDADPAVAYAGGHVLGKTNMSAHPSAADGMRAWARRAGCDEPATQGAPFDLDAKLPGAETVPISSACSAGIEIFRVGGGAHNVAADDTSMKRVLDALMATKAR